MFTPLELRLVEYRIMDTWKQYQDERKAGKDDNTFSEILEEHDQWVAIKRKMEACK